jgi:hypothetical protein
MICSIPRRSLALHIDIPIKLDYHQHSGMLPQVLREFPAQGDGSLHYEQAQPGCARAAAADWLRPDRLKQRLPDAADHAGRHSQDAGLFFCAYTYASRAEIRVCAMTRPNELTVQTDDRQFPH